MDELSHYVVEIKVTRVDFENEPLPGNYSAADRAKLGTKKRVPNEIAHIVVKNKNLNDLKALTAEHLKLVCE